MKKQPKFRQIRKGEKLKKGTILSHQQPSDDRLVVTKTSKGDGYVDVKLVKGWAPGRDFPHQYYSSFVVVTNAKPETPKQAIKRLTAELAEAKTKAEADAKRTTETAESVRKKHADQVKYYEDRLSDSRKETEAQTAARRAAENRASGLSATIDAMRQTIAHLGHAVQASALIART